MVATNWWIGGNTRGSDVIRRSDSFIGEPPLIPITISKYWVFGSVAYPEIDSRGGRIIFDTRGVHKVSFPLVPQLINSLIACSDCLYRYRHRF